MPALSAMRASLTLSAQLPDQRSGTRVTARPDEQLAPNRPILSALPLYMAVRCCMETVGASTDPSHHHVAPQPLTGGPALPALPPEVNAAGWHTATPRLGAARRIALSTQGRRDGM